MKPLKNTILIRNKKYLKVTCLIRCLVEYKKSIFVPFLSGIAVWKEIELRYKETLKAVEWL